MAYDLSNFTLVDMLKCGLAIRKTAASAVSMDDAAAAIVGLLYDECRSGSTPGERCALVRFYKTRPFGELEPGLREFAEQQLGGIQPRDSMKCLTLVATRGLEPAWSDPRRSVGHRAIPLPSERIVSEAPMISQLIREMGLEISQVVAPDPIVIEENAGRTYNVFHVEEAHGSPYIPAQRDFVEPYGIRSVVGFGGLLADGEFFAVILFSRGRIPADSAARFRNVALDVKAAIHAFARLPASYRTPRQ